MRADVHDGRRDDDNDDGAGWGMGGAMVIIAMAMAGDHLYHQFLGGGGGEDGSLSERWWWSAKGMQRLLSSLTVPPCEALCLGTALASADALA